MKLTIFIAGDTVSCACGLEEGINFEKTLQHFILKHAMLQKQQQMLCPVNHTAGSSPTD